MALEFTKLFKGTDVISQVGNFGFFKLSTESSGGGGGDVTFGRTFGENTPEQISAVSALISANNMTSADVEANFGWKIGDTISYQRTTGENVEMRIIGFNHDDKSDGSGKAGITLETVVAIVMAKMANSSTNAGGYPASLMKTTTLPAIKATLPTEWQNVIKMVDKKSANGGSTNYTEIITTSEDLFVLSENEVSGKNQYSLPEVEGTRYELYKSKPFKRSVTYWTRTPVYINTKAFVVVNDDGSINGNGAANRNYTPFAFCI
jgi:hypothetical protein